MCMSAGLCTYTCGVCNSYSITSVLWRCIKAYVYWLVSIFMYGGTVVKVLFYKSEGYGSIPDGVEIFH